MAYRLLKERYSSGVPLSSPNMSSDDLSAADPDTECNMPKDLLQLKEQLEDYQSALDRLGLRDYQVSYLLNQSKFYTHIHECLGNE